MSAVVEVADVVSSQQQVRLLHFHVFINVFRTEFHHILQREFVAYHIVFKFIADFGCLLVSKGTVILHDCEEFFILEFLGLVGEVLVRVDEGHVGVDSGNSVFDSHQVGAHRTHLLVVQVLADAFLLVVQTDHGLAFWGEVVELFLNH